MPNGGKFIIRGTATNQYITGWNPNEDRADAWGAQRLRTLRQDRRETKPMTGIIQVLNAAVAAHPGNDKECRALVELLTKMNLWSPDGLASRLMGTHTGENYFYCEYSHTTVFPEQRSHTVEGRKVCEAVFKNNCVSCEECGTFIFSDHSLSDDNNNYCLSCWESLGIFHCGDCDEYHDNDNPCPEGNERSNGRNVIMSHSRNVNDVCRGFLRTDAEKRALEQGGKNNNLFFGVELEVMPRNDWSQEKAAKIVAHSLKKYAIMKSDCTLHEETDDGERRHGFEIVTVPATLAFHREVLWNNFFAKNAQGELINGATKLAPYETVKSWNTSCCGLHIHFSREALSPMQLGKFLMFIHEPKNEAFLTKIAGRKVSPTSRWCRTRKKKLAGIIKKDGKGNFVRGTIITTEHLEAGRHGQSSSGYVHSAEISSGLIGVIDHYEAASISTSTSGKTIEVRIFRGNASKFGLMRALEFVAALIEYCGSASPGGLHPSGFLGWFNEPQRRGAYPDLWKHLLKLRYLRTKHKFKARVNGRLVRVVPEDEKKEPVAADMPF